MSLIRTCHESHSLTFLLNYIGDRATEGNILIQRNLSGRCNNNDFGSDPVLVHEEPERDKCSPVHGHVGIGAFERSIIDADNRESSSSPRSKQFLREGRAAFDLQAGPFFGSVPASECTGRVLSGDDRDVLMDSEVVW